jgi:hypothetical protein
MTYRHTYTHTHYIYICWIHTYVYKTHRDNFFEHLHHSCAYVRKHIKTHLGARIRVHIYTTQDDYFFEHLILDIHTYATLDQALVFKTLTLSCSKTDAHPPKSHDFPSIDRRGYAPVGSTHLGSHPQLPRIYQADQGF